MLANPEQFASLEEELENKGGLDDFHQKNGPIRARMMINLVDIPDDQKCHLDPERRSIAFEGTYDFCDTVIGVIVKLNPV